MEILSCEDLSFKYNGEEKPALDGCSFSVNSGEIILLCGKSGSGKSTLLKLLKRELSPAGEKKGRIFLFGGEQDRLSDREGAEKIGFVMQNPDDQTVCDKVSAELCFGLESLGVPSGEILARVGEMAGFFGIEPLYDRDVSTLSGGQKQLVNLCSVMVSGARLLLLDEPTAQLDPVAAKDFLHILHRLNDELGLTVIIAEHNPDDIFSSCDRVLYMEKGRTEFFGKPSKAAEYFSSHGLAEFLPAAAKIFSGISDSLPLDVRAAKLKLEKGFKPDMTVSDSESPSGEIVLKAENLWQRYEKNEPDILKGVDISVRKGECLALLGSNGAGKSTLLKALCGAEKCYMGKITLFGKKLSSYKNGSLFRNNTAMLPQDPYAMFAKESVAEELRENASEEQIKAVAGRLDIEELLERHPYDLSGGEIQNCAFAKILLSKPKLILLDECTKGMDGFRRKELGEILGELKGEGITLILVTHDLEFAAKYCDRCALFFDGKIVSEDNSRRFFAKNNFYTTAAARSTKGFFADTVTPEQVRERLLAQRGADDE